MSIGNRLMIACMTAVAIACVVAVAVLASGGHGEYVAAIAPIAVTAINSLCPSALHQGGQGAAVSTDTVGTVNVSEEAKDAVPKR